VIPNSVRKKFLGGKMELNPIIILDLVSLALSLALFHFSRQTQRSFGGLFRSAFAMFYAVAVLSLAISILELLDFIKPTVAASNIALHTFMFGVLLLMVIGINKLRKGMLSLSDIAKQIKS
jgi:hypothetical protein